MNFDHIYISMLEKIDGEIANINTIFHSLTLEQHLEKQQKLAKLTAMRQDVLINAQVTK